MDNVFISLELNGILSELLLNDLIYYGKDRLELNLDYKFQDLLPDMRYCLADILMKGNKNFFLLITDVPIV